MGSSLPRSALSLSPLAALDTYPLSSCCLGDLTIVRSMLLTCLQARVTFEADFLQFVRVRGLLVLYQQFFFITLLL